jgi:hypothetical protein
MATYKCEIKKQFGKFSGHVWKATERAGEPVTKDQLALNVTVDLVLAGVSKAGFGDGDEVIFRDNAFATIGELRAALLRSPY